MDSQIGRLKEREYVMKDGAPSRPTWYSAKACFFSPPDLRALNLGSDWQRSWTSFIFIVVST
jgi:hypothetical protein